MPGGLRPGPGAAGQLRVLRQPDRRVGPGTGRGAAARRASASDPRRRSRISRPSSWSWPGSSRTSPVRCRATRRPPRRFAARSSPRTVTGWHPRCRTSRPHCRTCRRRSEAMTKADHPGPDHTGPHAALAQPARLGHRRVRAAGGLHRAAARAHRPPGPAHRAGQGVGPAGSRRRWLPDRHEMGLHPAGVHGTGRQAQVPRRERGRGRARHLQGHPDDDGGPALAHRGLHHHLLRDPREVLRDLHPRGGPAPAAAGPLRGRAGVREGLPGPRHPRLRVRPGHRRARRRRCLHLRRGDGAARLAGGPPRAAAAQAALPGHGGPLRLADRGQQRRDHRRRSRRSCRAAARGSARWAARRAPARRSTRCPGTSRAPASTRRRWAPRCASCWSWRAG